MCSSDLDAVELEGPLRTTLGLAQWKRASSPGKAGTSGFLSVSQNSVMVYMRNELKKKSVCVYITDLLC